MITICDTSNILSQWHLADLSSLFFTKQVGKRRKMIDLLTSLTKPWNKLHSKAEDWLRLIAKSFIPRLKKKKKILKILPWSHYQHDPLFEVLQNVQGMALVIWPKGNKALSSSMQAKENRDSQYENIKLLWLLQQGAQLLVVPFLWWPSYVPPCREHSLSYLIFACFDNNKIVKIIAGKFQ